MKTGFTHRPFSTASFPPETTIDVLRRSLLVDGFDVVIDLKGSHGLWIRDVRNGRLYLDFFSFVGSNSLGMNHPALRDPEFMERFYYAACHKVSNSDIYTLEYAEFVNTFCRVVRPDFLPHLFFIEGGTQGVENALKAAFDWKVRLNFRRGIQEERGHRIIHFRQAFHGRSGYCLSLTNTIDPAKTQYFPKFSWPRIENPKIRFPMNEENRLAVERAEEEAYRQIEQAFDQNPNDIAAIIIEPIQGEGGDNHFRPEFLRHLRHIADEKEAMLIFDEVQTGLGMTGRMWAWEHSGVRPDMIVFGKKMQICGFMSSSRIDQSAENVFTINSRINSTWGGNLTDMVRCQRILETVEKDRLVDNAHRTGFLLYEKLQEMSQDYPKIVTNCRAAGLMQAFDLPDPEYRKRFLETAFSLGLLILPCGHASVRFRPPLVIDETEVDIGFKILRQVLEKLQG